jgi:cell division protein FtsB
VNIRRMNPDSNWVAGLILVPMLCAATWSIQRVNHSGQRLVEAVTKQQQELDDEKAINTQLKAENDQLKRMLEMDVVPARGK